MRMAVQGGACRMGLDTRLAVGELERLFLRPWQSVWTTLQHTAGIKCSTDGDVQICIVYIDLFINLQ